MWETQEQRARRVAGRAEDWCREDPGELSKRYAFLLPIYQREYLYRICAAGLGKRPGEYLATAAARVVRGEGGPHSVRTRVAAHAVLYGAETEVARAASILRCEHPHDMAHEYAERATGQEMFS